MNQVRQLSVAETLMSSNLRSIGLETTYLGVMSVLNLTVRAEFLIYRMYSNLLLNTSHHSNHTFSAQICRPYNGR